MPKRRGLLFAGCLMFSMLFFTSYAFNVNASVYWELEETAYRANLYDAHNWNRPAIWSDTFNWAPEGTLLGSNSASTSPRSVEVTAKSFGLASRGLVEVYMHGKFTWSAPPQIVYPEQIVTITANLEVFRDYTTDGGGGQPFQNSRLSVGNSPVTNPQLVFYRPYISSPSICSYKNSPNMDRSPMIWFGNSAPGRGGSCNHNLLPNGNAVFSLQEPFDNKKVVEIFVHVEVGSISVSERYTYKRRDAPTPPPPPPSSSWKTEVGIINVSGSALSGVLYGLNANGVAVWNRTVNIAGYGRNELDVSTVAGTSASQIKSMRLDVTSGQAVGYQKFYQAGKYRVGLEALPRANQNALYLPHIHSDSQWWTGVGLVNTGASAKNLGFSFSDGVSATSTLGANSHNAFMVGSLRGASPFTGSAQVSNSAGVAGLLLFGSDRTLSGVSLSDDTSQLLVFPHVEQNGWWTGVGIYNPNAQAATLTITGYDQHGGQTDLFFRNVAARGNLVFPTTFSSSTAWFSVWSSQPVTGFELFGTEDGSQLAGYSVVNLGTNTGIFPKLERNGWTGLAFVNSDDSPATITLEARNDNGGVVASRSLSLGGKSKLVDYPENLFAQQNISSATYLKFSSNRPIVGFQLNGSADRTMLDAIPALGATHIGTQKLFFPHIDTH